jgi:hypothetical protein
VATNCTLVPPRITHDSTTRCIGGMQLHLQPAKSLLGLLRRTRIVAEKKVQHIIALVSWPKDEENEDILDNIPVAWPAADAEAGDVAVETVKVTWGTMRTCYCAPCPDGSRGYSNFVPTGPDVEPHPHCLLSLLRKDLDTEPFRYAVELRHIHATNLNGKLSTQVSAALEQVSAPYRPVGSNG